MVLRVIREMEGAAAKDVDGRGHFEWEGRRNFTSNACWNIACYAVVQCDDVVTHLSKSASWTLRQTLRTDALQERRAFVVALRDSRCMEH